MIIRISKIENKYPSDLDEIKEEIKKTWNYSDMIITDRDNHVEIDVVDAKHKNNGGD